MIPAKRGSGLTLLIDYTEKLRCGKLLPPYFAYMRDLQNSLYNQFNNVKYKRIYKRNLLTNHNYFFYKQKLVKQR